MNSFPVPFKILLVILLTCLLVVIGIFNLRDRASWVDPTDGVRWADTGHGLLAEEVYPGGPGDAAGIRVGALLVGINGEGVPDERTYWDLLYDTGPNGSVSYLISSEGSSPLTIRIDLSGKPLVTAKDGLLTLLAFLYLGIGLFAVLRGWRQARAVHFYLICLAAFVAYLYSFTPKFGGFDKLVYLLSIAAFILLPALFIHFCLRFPYELKNGRSRAPLVYAPAIAFGLLQALWWTGHLARFGFPRDPRSFQFLDRLYIIYLSAGFLAGGAILWKRRSEARDIIARQQMKWISYGTIAGVLPFSLIYVIPVLFGARPSLGIEVSVLSLGLIPLSFAYAIIRYRLIDVEVIVRRGTAYFLTSSMLLAFYLFLVLVIGKGLQWAAPDAGFIIISLAALGIAMLFAPVRNAIQARLDRFFYKERFDDRSSLLEFARSLSSEISLGRLSRTILDRVSKTFQMQQTALFLADGRYAGFYRLTDATGIRSGADSLQLFRVEDLIDGNSAHQGMEIERQGRLHRAHPNLVRDGLFYLQELKLRGRRIGMIALGQLPGEAHFSTEDLDLLDALADYAAIALENANLYRSVEMKAMELERLKVYTENIIESVNVAIVALDLQGKITSCNRAFETLYHVTREQILGSRIEDLLPADVLAAIRKITGTNGWGEIRSVGNIFKMYLEDRQSEKLIVNLSVIPLVDSTDMNSGSLVVMDDVTANVRLQDQLLQSEKLSSIGLLAAGIAHEVNTPITGISSYTQMLLKNTPESDSRKSILEKIEKQTFRAAEIVNGLLNFARVNGSEYKDLDLNQLIQESISLLDHQMKNSHIQLDPHLDTSIPLIYGNSGKLQQVFVNLLLNARDAMPSGGEVRIQTSKNDTMVVVDITDTGVGISEEDIKRIYDPFFTTKQTGKGTGLGLAVTYGIIQEHGGRIFVDSAPGQGTHFRLKLPTRQSFTQ
jgi:two-component system NtrC family sensor kinase